MTDLNDFLRLVAEGKNDYKENNPLGRKLEEVKSRTKTDLGSLFSQLAEINKPESVIEPPDDIITESPIVETVPIPEIKPASQQYTPAELAKIYTGKSFQQPNPDLVPPHIEDIRKKLKLMEQAVGKIAALGPGSGEVNLRWLDDVNRATIADDRYLRYDAHTQKFVFDNPNGSQIGVLDYLQLNVLGTNEVPLPGTLSWNPTEDCLDVTQSDGSTLQVGLENYIQVTNTTGVTLPNGSVVKFGGVGGTTPLCNLMVGDSNSLPLYIIGVLTNDIPNGTTGRATILGKVHNINTTGSDVGETWQIGDILWVHPSIPGKMTRVKPTVPEVAVSVAAVLSVGLTNGAILVRPTIWPRLYYGTFSNTVQHLPSIINTADTVNFNTTNVASGFTMVDTNRITATESGLYNFSVSFQVSSTNSSAKNIYFWVRKNDTDIPNTTRVTTISGNNTQMTVACDWNISMNASDNTQIMWAVSDLSIRLDAPVASSFAPASPSVLLTITQVAL